MTTPRKHKARRKRNFRAWDKTTSALGNAELARIRMSREPEPRMVPWCRFRITVHDDLTGESGSFRLRSIRDLVKRIGVVLRYLG